MDNELIDNFLTAGFAWGCKRRTNSLHFVPTCPDYSFINRKALIHADDIDRVEKTFVEKIREHRNKFCRKFQYISLHRLRHSKEQYVPHISLISLTLDSNYRLETISGIDLPLPVAISLENSELTFLSKMIRNAGERFELVVKVLNEIMRHPSKPPRTINPFRQNWQCGDFIISPSKLEIVRVDSLEKIEISRTAAVFITLLLTARELDGSPAYVLRSTSRKMVFGKDASIFDNDLDKLVKSLRAIMGDEAIKTKRGYGHRLELPHRSLNP